MTMCFSKKLQLVQFSGNMNKNFEHEFMVGNQPQELVQESV